MAGLNKFSDRINPMVVKNSTRIIHHPTFWIALLAGIYILIILGSSQWNPITFVRVGGHFDPRLGNQEMGYDGQFAYQIARDPLNGWRYCDLPVYRYQRILYPMVVWLLSFGQSAAVPWVMLAVNFVMLVAGMYLLEKILSYYQQPAWFALIYGLYIGTAMSLRLDLNELLAYGLVLVGILAWLKQRPWLSAICFALAMLTKEVTLPLAAAFALAFFIQDRRKGLAWGAIAFLPYAVWRVTLSLVFQNWQFNTGGAMASSMELIPYFGWWKLALNSLPSFLTLSILIFPQVVFPSLAGIYLGGRSLLHHQFDPASLSLFFTSILIPFLPSSNILDPLGISRVLIGSVLAFVFFGADKKSRRILNFCLLFCITVVFLWKDSFLPVGIAQ
jgi:hypothetical protein